MQKRTGYLRRTNSRQRFAKIIFFGGLLTAFLSTTGTTDRLPAQEAASSQTEVSDSDSKEAVASKAVQEQEEQPTETSTEKPKTATLTQQAYALSRKVTSIEELDQILELLDQIEESTASPKELAYRDSLQAWALVGKGKRLLDEADRCNQLGKSDECTKLVEETERSLDQAIDKDEKNASAYHLRGTVYARQTRFELATKDFSTAIRLKPEQLDSWFNRAEVQYASEEFAQAISDYSHVLKQQSDDVQARTGRAHCYLQLGRFEEAIADYQAVVLTRPNCEAYTNLADACQMSGDWSSADENFFKATTFSNNNARTYCRIAWLYATCPEPEFQKPLLSLQAIKRAILLTGSETAEYLEVLAAAQAANGDFETAQKTQQRAIALLEPSDEMQERLKRFAENKPFQQSENKHR
jgi:tetratricopeptide (TPR) repeat protein